MRNRHDADRSVGKAAGFLVAPQYAVNNTSSSAHCAVQLVASQFERMIRIAEAAAGPDGPRSPLGPVGPAGPPSPFGPGGLLPHPARTAKNVKAIRVRWMCMVPRGGRFACGSGNYRAWGKFTPDRASRSSWPTSKLAAAAASSLHSDQSLRLCPGDVEFLDGRLDRRVSIRRFDRADILGWRRTREVDFPGRQRFARRRAVGPRTRSQEAFQTRGRGAGKSDIRSSSGCCGEGVWP